MVVKNHSGIVKRIKTWTNSHDELEVKVYGEQGFLWHFAQNDSVTVLERGRFYCPIYRKEERGRTIRKSNHLFYILNPKDGDNDTLFIEIGPDGFVNRAYQSVAHLERDLREGDLLPMWRVSSFGKPPEDVLRSIKRLSE